MWRGIQRSLAAWVAERDIGGVKAEGHLKRRFWPQVVGRLRAVKKLKLFHVKLSRSLHHEGVATADQLSADARDVSKLPGGVLSRANLDRAGGAYDWCAAQYGGREKLVTTQMERSLSGPRRYSSLLGVSDHICGAIEIVSPPSTRGAGLCVQTLQVSAQVSERVRP